MGWELSFLEWMQAHQTPVLNGILKVITMLGDIGWFWIVLSIILIIYAKTRQTGLASLISLAIMLILCNLIIKTAVARIRPYDVDAALRIIISKPHDTSFPSGHTTASFAVIAVLWLRKSRLRVPMLIIGILIAFSRLYFTVHYPTDVIAGALLGILCGILGKIITDALVRKFPKLQTPKLQPGSGTEKSEKA